MNEAQEILDLVNANDEVIGTVPRGTFNHEKDGGYVRAAEAFIVNQQGELWIPRRTARKTHAPNGLDFSVSEHVSSGRTYRQASVAGFSEEINTIIQPEDLEEVGVIPPSDKMPWFAAIFLYRSDVTPDFNRDDFTEGLWIEPNRLLDMIDAEKIDRPAKAGLAPAVRFLLAQGVTLAV